MALERPSGIDIRTRALIHVTGNSRAYIQQLELTKRELSEVGEADVRLVLLAVDAALIAVQAVNSIATETLRK